MHVHVHVHVCMYGTCMVYAWRHPRGTLVHTRCMRALYPHSTHTRPAAPHSACAACVRTIRVRARPKVRRAAMWLSCLNYQLSDDNLPIAESPFATVCTPYVFNKYRGIFGLSGSIGGQAELTYLASTYGAVKFEVPRFLDTCTGDARKVVSNHGVEVVASEAAVVARVVTLCEQWVQKVPVLVITSGPEELLKVQTAVMQSRGIVAEEVQRFSLFDANGRSLKDQWETLIADATKRLGGPADNRCRVTVTDRFGGRGHDYQVMGHG